MPRAFGIDIKAASGSGVPANGGISMMTRVIPEAAGNRLEVSGITSTLLDGWTQINGSAIITSSRMALWPRINGLGLITLETMEDGFEINKTKTLLARNCLESLFLNIRSIFLRIRLLNFDFCYRIYITIM